MAREIASAPDIVARQEVSLAEPMAQLASRLKKSPPQLVVTCARGSSAHAADFAKHLIELHLGIPVAAAAPSIASVYGRSLQLRGQLVLVISQSGASDDLIAFVGSARRAGAFTVAITNDETAPLVGACEWTVPIGAGREHSIPATKTFVATLAVMLRLTAAWADNAFLEHAVRRLPRRLADASALDWSDGANAIADTNGLATIGRGPTLAIAREAALKLKETCNLHAEAFSGAEFLHGPIALASGRYPLLMFMPTDAAALGMRELFVRLERMGTDALCAEPGGRLPSLDPEQPDADAVCLIQAFYGMLVRLTERLGIDPDRPRHLEKITRTT